MDTSSSIETLQTVEAPLPTEASLHMEAPVSVEAPQMTEMPQAVDAPQQMEAPQHLDVPQQTEASQPMDAPQQTEAPQAMDAPQQTEAPQPMDAPQQTGAPQPMDAPQQMGAPHPLDTNQQLKAVKPENVVQIEVTQPLDMPQQMEAPQPVDTSQQVEAPQPVDTSQQVEAPQPMDVPQHMEPVQAPEGSQATEAPQHIEPSQHVGTPQLVEASHIIGLPQQVETSQPMEVTQPLDAPQQMEAPQYMEAPHPVGELQYMEAPHPTEAPQTMDASQAADASHSMEQPLSVEHPQSIEALQSVEAPQPMETDMAIVPMSMETDTAVVPATTASPIANSDSQPNKRRRKKSIVWEHFTVQTIAPGRTRAYCKQCNKSFAYITDSKLAGTSHLKRHIALGICPVSRQRNQNSLIISPGSKTVNHGSATDPPKRRYRSTAATAGIPFDQDRCSHEIAKMIILHDYPLNIVEHPGFTDFVRTLHPNYNMVSFNTVQGDCVALYLKEKQKLLNLLHSIPGRVSLTLDLWSSDNSLGYVFITGNFMDNDWKLHRHVLNVIMVPFPDSDHAFNQAVVACLSDWALESRLLTVAIDESFTKENVMNNLRGLLSSRNPHIFNGQLLIGCCYARVLSQLAQDALGSLSGTIGKIRDSVKYVKTSEAHEDKFSELKHQLQVPSMKDLVIDDLTRWNTTYHMLVAACELKEVFACFDASDPDYKLTPSMEEWKQVEILCSYLKILLEAAEILTASTYPTANTFFHEASKIQIELTHAATSQDPFISNLMRPLQERFDRYWRNCCLILAAAVVMDPRFKMKLVEFSFTRIFGEDAETWIRIADDSIHDLYLEYLTPMPLLPAAAPIENGTEGLIKTEMSDQGMHQGGVSHEELPHDGTLISFGDGLSDFDVYISEITSSQQTKSELDQYLDESLLPRVQDFDVLGWWKLNKLKYPTLSRMAADVLSIPVSTVPSDSVFDTQSRKIDSYRGSLRPVTLEALVCAKDWLQHGSPEISNASVKAEH